MFGIFSIFFALGWVSFGGPAAHIGYFHRTFVTKLKWLDDHEYAQLVALSQFLPGPGSSQIGFALGYKKGGVPGGCLAFIGFTLPSMLIMLALAMFNQYLSGVPVFSATVHGLKLLAVVVVADATWSLYNRFCQSKFTSALCLSAALALLLLPGVLTQLLVLLGAALTGKVKLAPHTNLPPAPFVPSTMPLLVFVMLLLGLPLVAPLSPMLGLFSDFYQAGSLVFGGGHVVLPLLQNIIGDTLSQDTLLTGYAAAQAVPGPMFTFATFIGYSMSGDAPLTGALLATAAVFLPGFLLLLGVMRGWYQLAAKPAIAGAINGVNAAVVGLLLAALCNPVLSSSVAGALDIALIVVGFYCLKKRRWPLFWVMGLLVIVNIFSHLYPSLAA